MTESSAGYFPDAIALLFTTFNPGRLEATDVTTAYNGREVRRARFPVGGYRKITAITAPLSTTNEGLLRNFLKNRRGKYEAFYIFQPNSPPETAFPIGTGDGGTTVFEIPFKSSVVSAAYNNGSSVSFTQQLNTGSGGEDQVTYAVAPVAGHALTVDVIGRPRLLVRSDMDDYVGSVIPTADMRTIWNLAFREVV